MAKRDRAVEALQVDRRRRDRWQWGGFMLTELGELYFVCGACGAKSPPRPDEPGNSCKGSAWRAALELGWRETTIGLAVWCWCPKHAASAPGEPR